MDVLLVDDHPILHETLRVVVGSVAPQAQFHGETSLGGGISKARQLKDLQLVLLDLMLPGCSGIDALVQFLKVLPRLRILIISATEDSDSVRAALDAGAVGYLPKTSNPKVIAEAVSPCCRAGPTCRRKPWAQCRTSRSPPRLPTSASPSARPTC